MTEKTAGEVYSHPSPLKKSPPGVFAEKLPAHRLDLLSVALPRCLPATSSHLSVSLHMAVMAQGSEVVRVKHQPAHLALIDG